jgi:hypothetical protein
MVHFRLILLLKSTQFVPHYKLLRLQHHVPAEFISKEDKSLTSDVTQSLILYSRLPGCDGLVNISRHFAGV